MPLEGLGLVVTQTHVGAGTRALLGPRASASRRRALRGAAQGGADVVSRFSLLAPEARCGALRTPGLGTKFHLFSEDSTADTVTLRPFVFRRSALLAKLTSLGFPEGSYHLPALLLCRRAPSLPDLLTTRGPNTQTNIVLPCPDWYSRAMAKEFWVNTSVTIPPWAKPFFN